MTDSAKIIELLDKIGDKIIEEKEFRLFVKSWGKCIFEAQE